MGSTWAPLWSQCTGRERAPSFPGATESRARLSHLRGRARWSHTRLSKHKLGPNLAPLSAPSGRPKFRWAAMFSRPLSGESSPFSSPAKVSPRETVWRSTREPRLEPELTGTNWSETQARKGRPVGPGGSWRPRSPEGASGELESRRRTRAPAQTQGIFNISATQNPPALGAPTTINKPPADTGAHTHTRTHLASLRIWALLGGRLCFCWAAISQPASRTSPSRQAGSPALPRPQCVCHTKHTKRALATVWPPLGSN